MNEVSLIDGHIDNELSYENIIKALEYCSKQGITSECEGCNYKKGCRTELINDALNLICHYTAENEGLKEKIQDIRNETAKEFKVRLINNIDSGELYMSNDDYWMTIEHINRVEQEIINSVNETEESK